MSDRRYLLSIKELLYGSEAEQMEKQAYLKIDKKRLDKLKELSQRQKRAECLGAGLLLQLGLQDIGKNGAHLGRSVCVEQEAIHFLSVSQTIARLGEPINLEYTYGEKGKPYFRKLPLYFNLSHSADYVFCVFSEQEVGVDIQYKKPFCTDRVVRRFFTRAEQEEWGRCTTQAERDQLFYRLWTRKEAYGKLTGDGIAAAVGADVLCEGSDTTLGVFWEECEVLDEYQISICKRSSILE